MKIAVPFYTQHWDLNRWHDMGYKDREEAEYWEKSCCGILCAKMVMDAFLQQENKNLTPSVKEIIDLGIKQGAYQDSTGWSHSGLTHLIKSFGFYSEAVSMNKKDLRNFLNKNVLPIVSVKWAFKNEKTLKEKIIFWKKYGGHLAVVTGYEKKEGKIEGFYIHHTSKIKEQNWENKFLPIEEFENGYTGRGIIVRQNKS